MKRLLLATLAVCLLVGAMALSGGRNAPVAPGGLVIDSAERNPWTHLRLNNSPETFHFAVVSDRTGGHRARVFSQAVEQINLMQPSFVLSVGDLIEGYTKDRTKLAEEWKEFQTYAHKLQMPFFYVSGNHDTANEIQTKEYDSRFGKRYYHFLYRDVLILVLCSDDPYEGKEGPRVSKEQIEWAEKTLKENQNVRWTFVALHKPMWVFKNVETGGWLDMEKLLADRNYTVFAGHVHRYQKFVRQGMNYYQLATTGGGSKMRGVDYGEFDHIVWVTMKKDGPVLANILLDGIYSESMKQPVSAEEGYVRYNMKPIYPARGTVLMDGAPVAGARVALHLVEQEGKKLTYTADGIAAGDGTFTLSTYRANDGAPVGEFAVTVVLREPYFEPSGKLGPNRLPEKYADPKTTVLRVKIANEPNELNLRLQQ
ncbi:MAG: metallophosphoesterase [Gemmataceae bacterium]|nr:metallophosphoesterase [Gemmataceae bacterium]